MKYKNGKYYCNDPEELRAFFTPVPSELDVEGFYEPDHTDPIFDERYQVVLPTIAMESLEGLRLRGLNLTGIKEIDRESPNIEIKPWITINEMIIVISNGYAPMITSDEDAVAIYKAIKTYIEFWAERGKSHYADVHNAVSVPEEDISSLKQLMDSIYPLIAGLVEEPIDGVLGGLTAILDIPSKPKINIVIGNTAKASDLGHVMGTT